MRNTKLTKTLLAEGAIGKRLIVAIGSVDGAVTLATAGTDKLVGITDIFDAADGEDIDVHMTGVNPVECGAAVAYGDLVTSDANGKAVTAVAGDRVIGEAMSSTTASGQLVDVIIDRCAI